MRRSFSLKACLATSLLCMLSVLPKAKGADGSAPTVPAGEAILTTGSAWQGFVTWMPAVTKKDGSIVRANVWAGLTQTSPLPPEDWAATEFDDSSWFPWREPRAPMRAATVPVYEADQYGFERSLFIGLRCFRGRFVVEDPSRVNNLTLSLAFRGGAVAYVNGHEVIRAFLPKEGKLPLDAVADEYPEEASLAPGEKVVEHKPEDPQTVRRLNMRIRTVDAAVPVGLLRKGVNVLALEVHRAPMYMSPKRIDGAGNWSTCGLVSVELRGSGAIVPAVSRPVGLQVWNANVLTRITPFSGVIAGRIWQGGGVHMRTFAFSWGCPLLPLIPIRIVGTRNGVFTGQIGVSSDQPIRGLRATMSDLVHKNGQARIPAGAIQVCYQGFPSAYPRDLTKDPNVSLLDALYEAPPEEVPVRAEQSGPGTWTDGGAVAPVWIKVRVPPDTSAGEYRGTLTVRAASAKEVAVPVQLDVADWTLPAPKDFITHVGAVHSPDTLAIYYKVPAWSDEHFKLLEKTFTYAGELGGKVVYLPLVVGATWLVNSRSMVSWVKRADGGYEYDFRLFNRYMDLVQKHLKPEVACLYVTDGAGMSSIRGVNLLDPATGTLSLLPVPPYEPTPQSIDFWKPAIAQTKERLAKRGLGDAVMLGLLWESNAGKKGSDAVELFKQAAPDLKLVQIAHYAGQQGQSFGVPFGYVMSVWGNKTPVRSKVFGARDLPIKVAWHPRADAHNDIRPTAPRGALRCSLERSLRMETIGIAPLGMDFWNLPSRGALEGAGAWNLSMSNFTTAALLAPGPEGPVSTARFEMLREGLQESEALHVVERALADPATQEKLGKELVGRCRGMLAERARCMAFAHAGEWRAQGEGWQWFAASDWESRTYQLFALAGEVAKALGAK